MESYFELLPPEDYGKAVLVVDDDSIVQRMIHGLLNRLGFSNVLLATNGIEAMEVYFQRKKEVAVVVSDLQMPEMTGEELFWRLKEAGEEVRMILCSGCANGTDINAMLEAGLKGFLEKPFTIDQFELALAKSLT